MLVQILGRSYDINTKSLSLPDRGISELPESIGKLINLKELALDDNQLTILPESIGNLINLQYLDLSYNRLKTIPKSIGELVNLKTLFLQYNQLNNLPTSILNIKKSLYIDVSTYEINNLSPDTEFLIFYLLDKELTNLPTGLKEIWIEKEEDKKEKKELNHKLPFGCVIKYYE
jgi:Leucine-rich repeat (LRR) protein